MAFEKFEDHCHINLADCDLWTKRKLIIAMLAQALNEADLLVKWARALERDQGMWILSVYTQANTLIAHHKEFTSFLTHQDEVKMSGRDGWMDELIMAANFDPQKFWSRIRARVKSATPALAVASLVIKRGPPKNKRR